MTTNPEETGFRYDAALAEKIEKSWQRTWEESGTFHTPNPTGDLGELDSQDVSSPYAPPADLSQRESLGTSWTCSRTPPAWDCTATQLGCLVLTSTAVTSARPDTMSCTLCPMTPSTARQISTRCGPAQTSLHHH